jgi:cysteine desulfurase / selenocysteine lyase
LLYPSSGRPGKAGSKSTAAGKRNSVMKQTWPQLLDRIVTSRKCRAETGVREIYLDHASTSYPKPDVVWQSARDYLLNIGASPGRGGYAWAQQAQDVVDHARAVVADLLGVAGPEQIAFTANATAALNIAIKGVLDPGDHVVTTTMEHNSVLRPLMSLHRASGVQFTPVAPSPDGTFDFTDFEAAVTDQTRLFVINHASNVTGAVAPISQIASLAHKHGALILVDASQTAGSLPLSADLDEIDLIAFTGHKALLGPPGTGGLYVRSPSKVRPLMQGGTGSSSHSLAHPGVSPAKFEAGTLNYVGIAGLAASTEQLLPVLPAVLEHEQGLFGHLLDAVSGIPGVRTYPVASHVARVPVLSLNIDGLFPGEASALLDREFGIMTRAGLHCAPLAHRALGTAPHGTVRVSLGMANRREDIDELARALGELAKRWGSA